MMKSLLKFKLENKFLEDYIRNTITLTTFFAFHTFDEIKKIKSILSQCNKYPNLLEVERQILNILGDLSETQKSQEEIQKMVKLCYENQKILFEHSVISNKTCLERSDVTKKDISRLTQLFLEQIYNYSNLSQDV